jgi:hypothetical protein
MYCRHSVWSRIVAQMAPLAAEPPRPPSAFLADSCTCLGYRAAGATLAGQVDQARADGHAYLRAFSRMRAGMGWWWTPSVRRAKERDGLASAALRRLIRRSVLCMPTMRNANAMSPMARTAIAAMTGIQITVITSFIVLDRVVKR